MTIQDMRILSVRQLRTSSPDANIFLLKGVMGVERSRKFAICIKGRVIICHYAFYTLGVTQTRSVYRSFLCVSCS